VEDYDELSTQLTELHLQYVSRRQWSNLYRHWIEIYKKDKEFEERKRAGLIPIGQTMVEMTKGTMAVAYPLAQKPDTLLVAILQ